MNEDILKRKARKQIIIIIATGIAVILCDFIIAGNSNTLELVKGDKGMYILRPSAGQDAGYISLRAEVEGRNYSRIFDLQVDNADSSENSSSGKDNSESNQNSDGSTMSESELVAFEVRSAVNSINDDTARSRIYLPETLSTGDRVNWTMERRTNTALILLTTVLVAVLVYRNRFSPLKKQVALEQNSIARQLPEFVNRLVLLLNAGLVLNSAFEKASYAKADSEDTDDFFFSQLKEIRNRVRQTNGSMEREFSDFARSRRCAGDETSRQLMRISNIISDNTSKGVELTDKLIRESEVLWLTRKRNCEERGRIAETKLTLPLTLFLLVLIVITVSPALLEL